jgi:phosphoadenosine phosphosulfate reductase
MDEGLYERAIAMPLDQKIEKAIATAQHYHDAARTWDMFEPWYHACTSHGKDSVVMDWILKQAGVDYKLYNSHTTLDPPELVRFGRKHYPETVTAFPARPLLVQMVEAEGQGPPTRLGRWCCEIYKEQGCKNQIKVFGVRAEESYNRKMHWRVWKPHRADDSWILNPLLYWTETDVWDLIRREKIPYCTLYDEGFKRLGCIGCPMAGKGRLKEWARWPKYKEAWQRAFEKFWERWHGVPLERRRWVSCEGKYPFVALKGETAERRWVTKRGRFEDGFWTLRRWYDLKGYETWQELWDWWMQDETQPDNCGMGLA